MKNSFKTTIGIEIHLELNTKTKMFSSAPNNIHSKPNTNITPLDLGYPGTLPVVNIEGVKKAIKFAKALKMDISEILSFDRKNYFYPDLPKGYQITQDKNPIGKNGIIKLDNGKNIRIERVHIEEDTAKSIHTNKGTLLDFNRAGVPLIEIVTKPDISSAEEAIEYVKKIRRLALFQDVSDAKMSEGSLRADVNISVALIDNSKLGTRVEIKNMNSLNNIRTAIEFEVKTQVNTIINSGKVQQTTKRFDESTNTTIEMRLKSDSIDYKYFPEPNIPEIYLNSKFINSIKLNEMPEKRLKRYKTYKIEEEYINALMSDLDKANYFDLIAYEDKKKLAKIMFSEIVPIANEKSVKVSELKIPCNEIVKALELLDEGIISGKHLKSLFPLLVGGNRKTKEIVEKEAMIQISDVSFINEKIQEVFDENKKFIESNSDRLERVLKFLVGQVMKKTSGQANPVLTDKLVKKFLGE